MEKQYQYSKFLGENREEQIVIRCDTWEEFVTAKKNVDTIFAKRDASKPVVTNQQQDPYEPDEKECVLHKGIMMKKRTGQYGVFYSHTLGKDATGKMQYCNQN